jgi:hypothetical protein
MLTVDSVTSYLLERRLIDHSWIVGGELTIHDAARRNRNIQVQGPDGAGLFVKQPDATEEGGPATLRREANFYRFCRDSLAVSEVLRFLPPMIHDDSASATLVLELIPNAVSIRTLVRDQASEDQILDATCAIGHALGTVHRLFGAAYLNEGRRFVGFASKLPWILSLQKPKPAILANLSAANFELLRIVQADEGIFNRLEALRGRWEIKTVIHGDVKFEHFLIDPSGATLAQNRFPVWIVDWEMVGLGDSAWDLAGALSDLLFNWVSSMPIGDSATAEELFERATVPLADWRTLSRAMWSGYRAGACLFPVESDRLLLRAVKYSAARLIQSVFEISHEAERLSGRAVILLQLAANLLAEPELGQMQLYGIPLGSLMS